MRQAAAAGADLVRHTAALAVHVPATTAEAWRVNTLGQPNALDAAAKAA